MSLLTFAKKIAGRQERQAAPKKKTGAKKSATRKAVARTESVTHAHSINLQPWITEKSTDASAHNIVVFRVRQHATKGQITTAIQEQYGIVPLRIRTMRMMGKTRRRGRTVGLTAMWKKAYVTLPEGKTIDLSL